MNQLQRIGENADRPGRVDYKCQCGRMHALPVAIDEKLQAGETVPDICRKCSKPAEVLLVQG